MTARAEYRATAGRIRAGVVELNDLVARAHHIRHAEHHGDDWYVDALALNLHGFYSGVERLFEVVAEAIDQAKPAGPDWHQSLLAQMVSEIAGVRPAVVTAALRAKLDPYRGFRHVVRNVYTFNLDADQVIRLADGLAEVAEATSSELLTFADVLDEVAKL
jgi:hypothetical protein